MSIIRPAVATDAEAIARLCGELGYPATAFDIEVRRSVIEHSPEHALFVADVDGEVLGWLHACVAHGIEYDRCVEIRGLVVDERARGRRLGARLLAEAERWALSLGIRTVRVRSRESRERAHRFYLREGYGIAKRQLAFVKHLGDA